MGLYFQRLALAIMAIMLPAHLLASNLTQFFGGGSGSSFVNFHIPHIVAASLNTQVQSVTIPTTGNGTLAISVSGAAGSPEISIAGGAWATSGNITAGQTLAVRMTSANAATTTRTATITAGGFSYNWNLTSSCGQTQTFSYTGALQNTTVPAGCTGVTIKAWGAGGGAGSGGSPGGGAAFVGMDLAVTAGEAFTFLVGQGGRVNSGATGAATAYGGGGAGGGDANGYGGPGGGGRTSVYRGAIEILIAGGGGGGASYNNVYIGGAGGSGNPSGEYCAGAKGMGATLVGGGAGGGQCYNAAANSTAGTYLQGGNGQYSNAHYGGAGGGGGYYGGGGGGAIGAGGGGSNLVPSGGLSMSGSGASAANNSDTSYVAGRGAGGASAGAVGGNGYVVMIFY